MSSQFPFVQIPEELYALVGIPDPGTRIYRKDGSEEESASWFELITEIIGPSVSPGGASMICPVSRQAVYKRAKDGNLSMFLFHVTHQRSSLFGKQKTLRDSPFGYVPASELRAWRDELETRAVSQGKISLEELNGAKPDWHGDFLEWKNQRERFIDYKADARAVLEELGRLFTGKEP